MSVLLAMPCYASTLHVAAFLRSGLDTLAFLDADIGISGADFVKLVRLKKPIRGAAVNLKTLDHSESLSVFKGGKRLRRFELLNEADGPTEVDYLGGSVMLIEREVIEVLTRAHHELDYIDPIAGLGTHLFQEIVKADSLLSEDYSLCERARAQGFSVWCDGSVIVSHHEARVAWRF